METRKQELLKLIVENYVETAEPVGSKFLVEAGKLDISDATVRNEMRDLEEGGFLTHPHTSAGRIPTEAGYRFYVDHLMETVTLGKKIKSDIDAVVREGDSDTQPVKTLGKKVAEETSSAVIVAFGPNSVYYTGISFLFSQPEFRDAVRTIDVSAMFDRCEEIIDDIFDRVTSEKPAVLIGKENPFGAVCSLVGVRLTGDKLFTILGPLRMNYRKNISIIEYLTSKF